MQQPEQEVPRRVNGTGSAATYIHNSWGQMYFREQAKNVWPDLDKSDPT